MPPRCSAFGCSLPPFLSVCLSPFLSANVLSFKWHFLWRKHLQWSFVGDGRARRRCFFHSLVQRNTFSLLNWEIIGSELTLQWGLKCSFHSRGLSDASPFRPWRLSLQGFHSPGAPDWHKKISKILKQCQTWTQSDNIAFLCWSLLLRWDLVLYPRLMNPYSSRLSGGLTKHPPYSMLVACPPCAMWGDYRWKSCLKGCFVKHLCV